MIHILNDVLFKSLNFIKTMIYTAFRHERAELPDDAGLVFVQANENDAFGKDVEDLGDP